MNFNFNDFSKKVSNKDIVKIIKENNRQNYIIEKFNRKANISMIFNLYNFPNILYSIEIKYKNKIYYQEEDFINLIFEPNEEIRINLEDDIIDCSHLFYNCKFTYLDLSHFNTSKVTNMNKMFSECYRLEELDLSHFDTSKVIDMSNMFDGCYNLKELNLSSFNTSKVSDMSYMFSNCEYLKELDLSHFDTSNVINTTYMFSNCQNLKELNLRSFDTSKVTDMTAMFFGCSKLEKLDLSSFNTSKVTDMPAMFFGCSKLKELNLSHFNTHKLKNTINIFNKCNIPYEEDIENWLQKGGIFSNIPYPKN